jgi:outer membrane protein
MKKLTIALVLLFVSFAFAPANVSAQSTELKIGYVNPQEVLSKMPEMYAVDRRLKNFAEKKQKEFQEKQQSFMADMQAYEQKQAVISDDARAKEEQRLQTMQQELQQFEQTYQQELQQKQAELMGPLLEKVQIAIQTVSDNQGLTYVFNAMTSNGDMIILYASDDAQEKYDITQDVMDELDL